MKTTTEWQFFHKGIFLTSYVIYLILLIFIIDFVYTKFFERLPRLRTEVYLQMFEPSIHRRSEIEGLFYELKPNSKWRDIEINSLGMRDKEPTPIKNSYRVLVMGDSVTFGSEVRTEELFTEVAERILNNGSKKVEILNAGVCCYNTKQEFIALKEKFLNLHPDLVIFVFCINDTQEAAIQFLPEDYIQKRLLDGDIKPQKLHYNNLSNVNYLSLVLPNQLFFNYKLDRWLLLHSGIYRAFSILKFKIQHRIKDLKDLPDFLFAYDFDQVLHDIKKLSKEDGFLVKSMFPPVGFQWNKDEITTRLKKNGISFWDFETVVRKTLGNNYDLGFMRRDDVHFNPKGHLIVGKLLAERLKTLIH